MTTHDPHAAPPRVTQRQATTDVFEAYITDLMSGGEPEPNDELESVIIRATFWDLTEITDPMTQRVLNAIHAERRRRLSAATREGRRAS